MGGDSARLSGFPFIGVVLAEQVLSLAGRHTSAVWKACCWYLPNPCAPEFCGVNPQAS